MKEKLTDLVIQVCKFSAVGITSTIIDFGLLFVFRSLLKMDYMVASTISYSIALIFNYICSMKYVFDGRKDKSRLQEILIFLTLSLIGLGLNEWFIWLFHGKGKMNLMFAKLLATLIVTGWNFTSRKIFLEDRGDDVDENPRESLEN